MCVGEREPNFLKQQVVEESTFPSKIGARGTLAIDPKENSLWKKISKLSSKRSTGSEEEKGFIADQK